MNQRNATVMTLLAAALLAGALLLLPRAGLAVGLGRQGGPGVTPIYDIQGTGASSPMVDARVDTVGLVTGVTRNGFYLQDPTGDGNLDTSDGIYVFTYSPPAVRSGQCVAVRDALVQEYYGKTELSWVGSVEPSDACAQDAVTPVALPHARLGMDVEERHERREGMLVELSGLDGFVHGPTKRYASGEAEIAYLPDALQPAVQYGRIYREGPDDDLQDSDTQDGETMAGDALQYLSSLLGGELPPAKWGDRIRSGDDGADPLLAVMDYNFGKYQLLLLPGETVFVESKPAQEEAGLATSAEDFTVCTFNVHGLGRGAAQYPDAADYALELNRRAHMIADSLQGCTIIGVQETGTAADAEALAGRLRQEYALPYSAVAMAGPASGDTEFPLTNSFLVRSERVQVTGWFSSQGCSARDYDVKATGGFACPAGQYPLFNRPPLVMDATVTGDWGDPFALRVINNHWKSKAGDEQANAERRLRQAQHVAGIVEASFAGAGNPYVIVLGDLNDFNNSVPVFLLTGDAEYPLFSAWDFLPVADRYSFIFNGASQVLDHILISPNMVRLLSGVDAVHENADLAMREPGDTQAAGQVSDHDPLAVRLRPAGAAAVGGELGFPGIRVMLEHVESGRKAEALTGSGGEYRLWDIAPGEVRIEYSTPAWLAADPPNTTTVLLAGLTMIEGPRVRLDSAIRAAASASALVDAISIQQ